MLWDYYSGYLFLRVKILKFGKILFAYLKQPHVFIRSVAMWLMLAYRYI